MELLSKEIKLSIIQEFLNRSMGDIQEDQITINRLLRFTESMDGIINFTTRDSLHVYSRTLDRASNEWRMRLSDVDLIGATSSYNNMRDKVRYVNIEEFYNIFSTVPMIFLDGVKVNDSDVRIFIGNDKGSEFLISDKYDINCSRVDVVVIEPSMYTNSTESSVYNQGRHEVIGFFEDGSLIDGFTTSNSFVVEGVNKNNPKYLYTVGNLNKYLDLKVDCKGYFTAYDCITDSNILVFEDGILLEPARLTNKNNTVFKVEEFKDTSKYRIYVFNKDTRINSHVTLSLFREGYDKMEEFYINNYDIIDSIKNMDVKRYRDEYSIKSLGLVKVDDFIEDTFKFISSEFTLELAVILSDLIPTNSNRFSSFRLTNSYIAENIRDNTYDDVWGTSTEFESPRLRIHGKNKRFNLYVNGVLNKDYITLGTGYDDMYIYLKDFKYGDNIYLEYYDDSRSQNRVNSIKLPQTSRPDNIVIDSSKLANIDYTKESIFILARDTNGVIVDSDTGNRYSILPIDSIVLKSNTIEVVSSSELKNSELIAIFEPEILKIDSGAIIRNGNRALIPNILPRHLYCNEKSYIMSDSKMIYEDEDYIVNMNVNLIKGVLYTEIFLINDTTSELTFSYDINRRVIHDEISKNTTLVYIKDIIRYTSYTHRVWVDGILVNPDRIRVINNHTINVLESRYKRIHIEAYYENSKIFDYLKETYIAKPGLNIGEYDNIRNIIGRLVNWSIVTGEVFDFTSLTSNSEVLSKINEMISNKSIDMDYINSIDDFDLILTELPNMDATTVKPSIPVELPILESLKTNDIGYLSKEDLDLLFRSILIDNLFKSNYENVVNPWGTVIDDTRLTYLYVGDSIFLDMTNKPAGTIDVSSEPILLDFSDTSNYRPRSLFRNQGIYETQIDNNKFYGILTDVQKQNIINIYILRAILSGDIDVDDETHSMLVDSIASEECILLDLNMYDSIYHLSDDGMQLLDLEYSIMSFYPEFPDYELYLQAILDECN